MCQRGTCTELEYESRHPSADNIAVTAIGFECSPSLQVVGHKVALVQLKRCGRHIHHLVTRTSMTSRRQTGRLKSWAHAGHDSLGGLKSSWEPAWDLPCPTQGRLCLPSGGAGHAGQHPASAGRKCASPVGANLGHPLCRCFLCCGRGPVKVLLSVCVQLLAKPGEGLGCGSWRFPCFFRQILMEGIGKGSAGLLMGWLLAQKGAWGGSKGGGEAVPLRLNA